MSQAASAPAAASTPDALGDATRRAILEALRAGPRPVGGIAAILPVSRPTYNERHQLRLERTLQPRCSVEQAWQTWTKTDTHRDVGAPHTQGKDDVMGPMMQALTENLRLSNFVMNLITQDLKDTDARRRTRNGEGPSLAWVVGHLINYRYYIMSLLGTDKTSPVADIFGDSASDGSSYPPMKRLVEAWNAASEELEKAAASVTDEFLLAKPSDGPHGEKTRMSKLSFYVWHESYHFGQMGTLRRELGYPATADLAVAASKDDA